MVARLLQGLSVGGEYGASATYLSEMAGATAPRLLFELPVRDADRGQLIALVVLLVAPAHAGRCCARSLGWRIPFVIGGVLRRRRPSGSDAVLTRRPSFRAAERQGRGASFAAARACSLTARSATVVGLTAGGTVAFYTFTTYVQKFLVNTGGWSKADATRISAPTLLVFMLIQPLVGCISDRVGRRPVLIAFGVSARSARCL